MLYIVYYILYRSAAAIWSSRLRAAGIQKVSTGIMCG